jgi:hypothetical protein
MRLVPASTSISVPSIVSLGIYSSTLVGLTRVGQ